MKKVILITLLVLPAFLLANAQKSNTVYVLEPSQSVSYHGEKDGIQIVNSKPSFKKLEDVERFYGRDNKLSHTLKDVVVFKNHLPRCFDIYYTYGRDVQMIQFKTGTGKKEWNFGNGYVLDIDGPSFSVYRKEIVVEYKVID